MISGAATVEIDWRERAACRRYDPEWWTLAAPGDHYQQAYNQRAQGICGGCPVSGQCDQLGRTIDGVGLIWGGQPLVDRSHARKYEPVAALPPRLCEPCGQMFQRTMPQQQFCTDHCRGKSRRAKEKAAEKMRRWRQAQAVPS